MRHCSRFQDVVWKRRPLGNALPCWAPGLPSAGDSHCHFWRYGRAGKTRKLHSQSSAGQIVDAERVETNLNV